MGGNKELTFDDFRKMAADSGLSASEKIGFPDSYRKGYSGVILKDIFSKLPIDKSTGGLVIDIGCGCDELTLELIKICNDQQHRLVLIDSKEMLDQLPDAGHVTKCPGKFPFEGNEMEPFTGKADFIICYSVLFYVFANDNLFNFLHAALGLLKPGGKLLLGDIPNIDKRDRFLSSEKGIEFLKNNALVKGSTAHENKEQKMDDSIVMSIITRIRKFGCESYLMPQSEDLPMSNRREDILVIKR